MPRMNAGDPADTHIFAPASPREIRRYWLSAVLGLSAICSVFATKAHACSAPWYGQTGVASYYGPGLQGNRTASGEAFDMNAMTAAHPCLPMGTKIKVTLLETGRTLIVTINDRLPSRRRVLDLSVGAARALGMLGMGLGTVEMVPAG